eukprot:TRINITY_DN20194_c0_g1_i1.p1 TRINITY_DN20194_c0_g1~~TRINITY_DN20194_c0_g1_i1.p1  ORF type:complete len:657 (+),score=97.28 TRINITY_DN20194_c0_g1_i1:46-2016(+)
MASCGDGSTALVAWRGTSPEPLQPMGWVCPAERPHGQAPRESLQHFLSQPSLHRSVSLPPRFIVQPRLDGTATRRRADASALVRGDHVERQAMPHQALGSGRATLDEVNPKGRRLTESSAAMRDGQGIRLALNNLSCSEKSAAGYSSARSLSADPQLALAPEACMSVYGTYCDKGRRITAVSAAMQQGRGMRQALQRAASEEEVERRRDGGSWSDDRLSASQSPSKGRRWTAMSSSMQSGSDVRQALCQAHPASSSRAASLPARCLTGQDAQFSPPPSPQRRLRSLAETSLFEEREEVDSSPERKAELGRWSPPPSPQRHARLLATDLHDSQPVLAKSPSTASRSPSRRSSSHGRPGTPEGSVIIGHGERGSPPSSRRGIPRGEAASTAEKIRSAAGVSWRRQMPKYRNGHLAETMCGEVSKMEGRASGQFQAKVQSGHLMKELLAPVKEEASAPGLPSLSAAAAERDAGLERTRRRCIAKFDKLCVQQRPATRGGATSPHAASSSSVATPGRTDRSERQTNARPLRKGIPKDFNSTKDSCPFSRDDSLPESRHTLPTTQSRGRAAPSSPSHPERPIAAEVRSDARHNRRLLHDLQECRKAVAATMEAAASARQTQSWLTSEPLQGPTKAEAGQTLERKIGSASISRVSTATSLRV